MIMLFLATAAALATAKYDAYLQREVHVPTWHWSAELRNGRVIVEPSNKTGDLDIGGALIHDWTGEVFIPSVNLGQVVSFLQDYDIQANYYRPDVVNTRLLSHHGNTWNISYRIVQKTIVTVVLDVNQTITYYPVSPTRVYTMGNATRIVEKPGKDHGYLWRLNTYWSLEEMDGGVYMESRSISLSRTAPFGLGWMFNPIASSLPGESLSRQLTETRIAVRARG
jgi:hypothetical protein